MGELKAGKPADGKVSVTLFFPSNPVTGMPPKREELEDRQPSRRFTAEHVPAPARERLARQLKRMVAARTKLASKAARSLSFEMQDRISGFDQFVARIPRTRCSFKLLGRSLLLLGLRLQRASLYDRLGVSGRSWSIKLTGIEKEAVSIFSPRRTDNAAYVGSWPFREDGRLPYRLGMTHPFWWPLSADSLRQLALHQVVVFTVFNPAHLFERLEHDGFATTVAFPKTFSAEKRVGNKLVRLEGLAHYFELMQQYFFSEDDIAALLRQVESELPPIAESQAARIELDIEQAFFARVPT